MTNTEWDDDIPVVMDEIPTTGSSSASSSSTTSDPPKLSIMMSFHKRKKIALFLCLALLLILVLVVVLVVLLATNTKCDERMFHMKPENCDEVCADMLNPCSELTKNPVGFTTVGSRATIYPQNSTAGIEVYCDCSERNNGGWLVFQRRLNTSTSFNRTWSEYVQGFGSVEGNLWLGLENIHTLTKTNRYKMKVEISDWNDDVVEANYRDFKVGDESSSYTLYASNFSGNARDSLGIHQGMKFSTPDRDNDVWKRNCARTHSSGWWFTSCRMVNLNGIYYEPSSTGYRVDGIVWYHQKLGYDHLPKTVEMKIKLK